MDPNVFETANAGFAQAMYEEFLRDPSAVGPEWRRLFESGVVGENGKQAGRQVSQTPSLPADPLTRLGYDPHQRPRRQARGEYEREPHRSHSHHLP